RRKSLRRGDARDANQADDKRERSRRQPHGPADHDVSSAHSLIDDRRRREAAARGSAVLRSSPHGADAMMDVDQFYSDADSLFVRAYDAFVREGPPQIAGDVQFYARLAKEAGGRVLEVACGTGRLPLPPAEAGVGVTSGGISVG